MSENTALVRAQTAIVPAKPAVEKRARITEEDAVSYPEVEIVSEEELRHGDQVKSKAKAPETFFTKMPEGIPEFPGADVSSKVLLGFLAAAEHVVSENESCPILSSVKVTYRPGDEPMLYVEAIGGDIWTVVAIKAGSTTQEGFTAMMPLRHARNAVNAVSLSYKSVLVGLRQDKLCLGPTMVPYGGKVEDYPPQPVLRDWEARAAVPAFYFEEVCSRVIPAQSQDPTQENLHGVLLDYDICEIDGQMRVLCTAVSTDGHRLHMMRLPRMQIDPSKGGALPPSVVLSEKYFRYLSRVANREWTALELSESQVIARGEDYVAVTKATMRGDSHRKIESWRKVDVDYEGFWTVDEKDLERIAVSALEMSGDEEVRIRIDSVEERLEICSWCEDGGKFKDTIPARRFGGPPAVHVTVNGRYLVDAVSACRSGLIRLGFSEDVDTQRFSAVVIRGEDELFKAIIMPIGG